MLNKGDFIEINFVGRLKEDGKIFDLTDEKVAKDENIYNKDFEYKPVIICLGFNDILKGLDGKLIGKEIGKYKIEISAENGFGKKKHDLIKLVPSSLFLKNNIKPVKGLQVDLDNIVGKIISVSGGRCIVDFNHPLSSKDLIYDVEVLRVVDDLKEKIESVLRLIDDKLEVEINEDNVEIKGVQKELQKFIEVKLKERIKEIKTIGFKI
ncbi:MAG: FKBP-type peptidyl-prolyl cis-trans isomerase [Nanoarchaeota archaeon]|nr:FKBP-type peptidyl-prolyl cis-trans isomerase [Nanoarchaeota archaeon]